MIEAVLEGDNVRDEATDQERQAVLH